MEHRCASAGYSITAKSQNQYSSVRRNSTTLLQFPSDVQMPYELMCAFPAPWDVRFVGLCSDASDHEDGLK